MSSIAANQNPAPPRAAAGKTSGRLASLTIRAQPDETIPDLCRRLAGQLKNSPATPLHLLAFGNCQAHAAVLEALAGQLGAVDFPVTWVDGGACGDGPIAGLQVQVFTGPVERVVREGRHVGSIFTDGGARQCVVGGLGPGAKAGSRAAQTARTLEHLQAVLEQAGFGLADVVRTWFYLDKILSWYNEFNRARTRIYSGVKFHTGSLPASTGIGARNPAGTALTLAAWAFRPVEPGACAKEVASPMQCPAPAYGSSFSRAMEISTNGGRQLFISGTASIALEGQTLWVGDVRKQVEMTMEVVEAILRSRGMSLDDLSRATAYFRRAADAAALAAWMADRGRATLPVVATECDICRDDLLFELEAEAISETTLA
jgi:enamine deaminase RidA (YjgF/YER057c/UK114 family)